jgi:hypothetical protein
VPVGGIVSAVFVFKPRVIFNRMKQSSDQTRGKTRGSYFVRRHKKIPIEVVR